MEERLALVTGGTRGIGLGCAKALAREGWNLAVCGVRPEAEARPALDELRGFGGEVLYVQADIGGDDAPDLLIGAVTARFGRLDLLVNNAGVAPKERRDILEATAESFDRVLRINLRGPYFLTQAAARFMCASGPRDGVRPSPAGTPGRCIVFITESEVALRMMRKIPPNKPDDFWLSTGSQMLQDFHRITSTWRC